MAERGMTRCGCQRSDADKGPARTGVLARILIFLTIGFLLPALGASAKNVEDNYVFESNFAGFRVTKPESWRVVNAEEYLLNLERKKLPTTNFINYYSDSRGCRWLHFRSMRSHTMM